MRVISPKELQETIELLKNRGANIEEVVVESMDGRKTTMHVLTKNKEGP